MTDSPATTDNEFTSLSIGESLQMQTHVAPFELVELFYDGHNLSSTAKTSSMLPCNLETDATKTITSSDVYKCERCGREFKEASHFAKHKRGSVCKKIAKKLAKKRKKLSMIPPDKKTKTATIPYKPFLCNLCGAKFCDRVNVELHLERSHQTNQQLWLEVVKSGGYTCSECHLWFSEKHQLRHHQQGHIAGTAANNSSDTFQTPIYQPQSSTTLPNHQYFSHPSNYITNYNNQPITHNHIPQMSQPVPSDFPNLEPYAPSIQETTNMPTFTQQPVLNNEFTAPESSGSVNSLYQVTVPLHNNPMNRNKSKEDRSCNSSLTWNICGDCGCKFLDVINLELHLLRNHPHSKIIDAVYLGVGFTLYRTNNSGIASKDVSKYLPKKNFNSSATRGHKVYSITSAAKNLQPTHDSNNLTCKQNDHTEIKKNQRNKRTISDNVEQKSVKCASCLKLFQTEMNYMEHKNKDQKVLCGICPFSSCSDSQVAIHTYTCHRNYLPSSLQETNLTHPTDTEKPLIYIKNSTTDSSECLSAHERNTNNKLSCHFCVFAADSGLSLAEHFFSHGSVDVHCCKCKDAYNDIISFSKHVKQSHTNQVVRMKLVLKYSSQNYTCVILISPKLASQIINRFYQTETLHPDTNITTHFDSMSADSIYACSECGACLRGSSELQTHTTFHQTLNHSPSPSQFQNSDHNISLPANPLVRVPDTVEFKCEECGFGEEESQLVIQHIQGVHMSGNMIHLQKPPSKQLHTIIHVFTPISSFVSE